MDGSITFTHIMSQTSTRGHTHTDAWLRIKNPDEQHPEPPSPTSLHLCLTFREDAAASDPPPDALTSTAQNDALMSKHKTENQRHWDSASVPILHFNAQIASLCMCLSLQISSFSAVLFFAWQHSELSMLSESQQNESCDLQLIRERERQQDMTYCVKCTEW